MSLLKVLIEKSTQYTFCDEHMQGENFKNSIHVSPAKLTYSVINIIIIRSHESPLF